MAKIEEKGWERPTGTSEDVVVGQVSRNLGEDKSKDQADDSEE